MTRTKSTFLALLAVLLSPMAANADLIVTLSDDGTGNTLVALLGSATLAAGSQDGGGGFAPNSVGWQDDAFASNFISSVGTGCGGRTILSGSATASSSAGGASSSLFDLYVCDGSTRAFAPRWGIGFTHTAGAVLSWSGSFIADIAFSQFIAGTYSTQFLGGLPGTTGYFGTLVSTDSYIVQVGSVQVPEPGTLALLGIGLFGMGLARRNKKA